MSKGFVALLDLLGFSSLVMGTDAADKLGRYLGTIRAAFSSDQRVEFVVFSDTIVLTALDHSDETFQILLQRTSALFGGLLKEDIAVRGAIAYGSFIREGTPGGVFVAGSAVVDAFSFENQQDWVGIMLAPSTIRRIPDIGDRCQIHPPGSSRSSTEGLALITKQSAYSGFVQRCGGIPFHSNDPFASNHFEGFAVVPTSGISTAADLSASISESLKRLQFMKSVAPNPSAQKKYQEAIQWLRPIQFEWQEVAGWQERLSET